MVPLSLSLPRRGGALLCLGAHADDIEIGCAGTVLQLLAARRSLSVTWVVFSAPGARAAEARRSAARLLVGARHRDVRILAFPDSFFPEAWGDVKRVFRTLARETSPDLIFTHHAADRHQDHRVLAELTWNAFRDHTILEYEVPKYDGDLITPNVYVPLDAATRRRKVRHILAAFPTQRRKHWFTEETLFALMRIRGVECGTRKGYAEGFHGRKLVLSSTGGKRAR